MLKYFVKKTEIFDHFISLFSIYCLLQFANGGPAQRKLLKDLFKNYNKLERPVTNDNETLSVNLGMTIQQIVDILKINIQQVLKIVLKDEKMSNILFSGWLDMSWTDYSLAWNPDEYEGITKIRVPSSEIWTPDILLYNSADDSFDMTSKVNAVLYHTGKVDYIPPGMFRSTCDFKIKDFPFDRQICSLKFGSWTHDESYINVTNVSNRGQNGSYIKNPEWILEDIISFSESISYDCCPEKYPFVMFEIQIRRRTLFYEFNLIFPCVFISCLTLLGFLLPPDSGDKISLEATILLVIITFSQIVSSTVPVSSLSISRIGLYFKSIMVISSLSIVANIVVLIIHHRNVKNEQYIPRWFEVLVYKYLVKLLRMRVPFKIKNYYELIEMDKKAKMNEKSTILYEIDDEFSDTVINLSDEAKLKTSMSPSSSATSTCSTKCRNCLSSSPQVKRKMPHQSQETRETKSKTHGANVVNNATYASEFFANSRKDIILIKQSLNELQNSLYVVSRKVEENTGYEDRLLRCKFAAVVIDRLCMLIFALLLLLSTAIM